MKLFRIIAPNHFVACSFLREWPLKVQAIKIILLCSICGLLINLTLCYNCQRNRYNEEKDNEIQKHQVYIFGKAILDTHIIEFFLLFFVLIFNTKDDLICETSNQYVCTLLKCIYITKNLEYLVPRISFLTHIIYIFYTFQYWRGNF